MPDPTVSLPERWCEGNGPPRPFKPAVGLPKAAAATLYALRQQGSGLAHIAWRDWIAAPTARSFQDKMLAVLDQESASSR
jgi:hypothetical protein